MNWPVAYRGGIGKSVASRAVAQTIGLSTETEWFTGAAAAGEAAGFFALKFAGAVGLAVSVVELYRFVALHPEYLGWTINYNCNGPGLGPFPGDFTSLFCASGSSLTFSKYPAVTQTSGILQCCSITNVNMFWAGSGWRWQGQPGISYHRAQTRGDDMVPPAWTALKYNPAGDYVQSRPYTDTRPVPPPGVPGFKPYNPPYPDAGDGGTPDWGPVPRPTNPTVTLTPTTVTTGTKPDVRARPTTHTLEKKLSMSPGAAKLVTLFNEFTEFADFVGAIYGALPKSQQTCRGVSKGQSYQCQMDAIERNWQNVDWSQAMFNAIWQNFTDEIWAKLGLPTKEAGLPYGTNAPVNVALGKALGDQVAAGTKTLKSAWNEGLGTFMQYASSVLTH